MTRPGTAREAARAHQERLQRLRAFEAREREKWAAFARDFGARLGPVAEDGTFTIADDPRVERNG